MGPPWGANCQITLTSCYKNKCCELNQHFLHVWHGTDQTIIDNAIDECMREKSGHFEQLLWQYSAIRQDISVSAKSDTIFRLFFWKLPQFHASNFRKLVRQHTEGMVRSIIWVLLEIYLAFQQWKNFKNTLRIDKVITMSLVYYLFGTLYIPVWAHITNVPINVCFLDAQCMWQH